MRWTDKLANELHKPIKRKFPQRRVIVNGIDEIWSADLVDMQAFSRYNKGIKYLLNVIDVFSKYAWSVPVKNKTGVEITKAFQQIIKERKPKMLWVDQGSEFYNKTFQEFLKNNDIQMYHTFNEGKAVVVERFNRTLKNKMWKYFSANNTNKYLNVLPVMIKKYNNTKHSSIKMTPTEASLNKNEGKVYYQLYGKLQAFKGIPKFNVNDKVRISKKKKMFEKGYTPNWTEEIFVISQIQNTNPITYKLKDLNEESIEGSFYEPELQKAKQEVFRIEKVLRKDHKKGLALVKWKGYSNAFNSWVSLKDIQNI